MKDFENGEVEPERFSEEKNQLLLLLLKNHTVEEVVSALSNLLDKALVFIDINFAVRSYEKQGLIKKKAWHQAIANGYCSHEFIFQIVNIKDVNRYPSVNTPYSLKMEDGEEALVSPIIIRKKYAGALVLFSSEKIIDNRDHELLLLGNEILTELILKVPAYKYIRGYLNEGIMLDLIEGRDKSNPEFCKWLLESELNVNESLCILVAEKSISQNYYHERIKDSLRDEFSHIFPGSPIVFYGRQMVILGINLHENRFFKKPQLFQSLLKDHSLKIGVSDFFYGIELFQQYLLQARAALRLGQRVFLDKELFSYSQFRFDHLLESVELQEEANFDNFMHQSLQQLKGHDESHKGELFKTLRALIQNGNNLKNTCESLHIHRNTLGYRIERIKDLTQLDLSRPEVLFELAYSFRIDEYLKNKA
ncbi:helix-turn-helix domain-containing protein [Eubacteriaceae bacterium ES2]|nr:helix-turn-helix domain-containing protein [Eubacteriaceae bacterium ES2]